MRYRPRSARDYQFGDDVESIGMFVAILHGGFDQTSEEMIAWIKGRAEAVLDDSVDWGTVGTLVRARE